jgi:hypothetical protein
MPRIPITVKTESGGRKKLFDIKNPGAFTRKRDGYNRNHGTSLNTKQFAGKVLANKEDFPSKTVRQAATAKGLMAMKKKG